MKSHNKLSTIIVLSIFVLGHILPLHNAISHCVDGNVYDTVDKLQRLYEIRVENARNKQKALTDAENTDKADFVREYIITHTTIGMGTAAIGSTLTAGITLLPAIGIGYITGVATGTATGTIAYYKAISDAKEALKTAEEELDHAAAKLEQAKERQAREAIQPNESQISAYETHTINISTGKPIKNVEAYIAPEDPMNTNAPVYINTGDFSNNVYSTTLSHVFSTSDKGLQSVWVTIYLTDETTIYRSYQILVTD